MQDEQDRRYAKYLALYQERLAAVPFEVTAPLWRYLDEEVKVIGFVTLIVRMARTAAVMSKRISPDSGETIGAKEIIEFGTYGTLTAQMLLTRQVDNFLTFIAEMLGLVFRTRPETLRSDEVKVALTEILRHGSMDDLIASLTDKRVNDLAYKGLRELSRYLSTQIKLELFPDEESMDLAIELIEQRNVVVHNRGIINQVFLSKLPASRMATYAGRLGKPLEISVKSVAMDNMFLRASVVDIDMRARQKFDLPMATRAESIAHLRRPSVGDW